jgi:hypothetical protein
MRLFGQFDNLEKMKHLSFTEKNRERSLQRGLRVESDAKKFERAIGKSGRECKELIWRAGRDLHFLCTAS